MPARGMEEATGREESGRRWVGDGLLSGKMSPTMWKAEAEEEGGEGVLEPKVDESHARGAEVCSAAEGCCGVVVMVGCGCWVCGWVVRCLLHCSHCSWDSFE